MHRGANFHPSLSFCKEPAMNAIARNTDANSEKAKALAAALAQIEKQFGKGTIMKLGEGEALSLIHI